MARPVTGDVVVVPFPFSNLQQSKRRPALVVSTLQGDDLILCQITSRSAADLYSISLQDSDFVDGNLRQTSSIRPNRIFTADRALILYKVGSVREDKIREVIEGIIEILRHGLKA